MQTIRKLLQPDIAVSEKYHIFLESVRYLRKSEQDASYNEILKQLSELAQRVMKDGEKLSGIAIQQYVRCYEVFLKEKVSGMFGDGAGMNQCIEIAKKNRGRISGFYCSRNVC